MNARLILALFVLHLAGSISAACQVPVFRYALENWEPDRLTVAILHRGKLDLATQALVEQLEAAADRDENPVNLQVHPIDVAAQHPAGSGEEFHAKEWREQPLPHALVYFSNDSPKPQLAWSAALNQDTVSQLLESPKRKLVTDRLLDGQSAVWVLLKSGDKVADAKAETTLREQLQRQPDLIELPSLTDLATEEKFDATLDVDLRVEFSIVAIEPDDKQEQFFREMLLNTEADLKDFKDPIAIPIYGRGRTYFALVGPGITSENIEDNCQFICGACSCEVKGQNPGQDLLLAANWHTVEPGNWVNETPLPELTGIGQFEPLVNEAARDDSAGVDSSSVSGDELSSDAETPERVTTAVESATAVRDVDANLVASLDRRSSDPKSSATKSLDSNSHSDAAESRSTDATSGSDRESQQDVERDSSLWLPLAAMIAVLFGLGMVFTIWQRRRNPE